MKFFGLSGTACSTGSGGLPPARPRGKHHDAVRYIRSHAAGAHQPRCRKVGTTANPKIKVTWIDNSTCETNWTLQRSKTATGPWTNIPGFVSTTGPQTGGTVSYTDTTVASGRKYYYQALAINVVGDSTVYAAPEVGYPTMEVDSVPSNVDPATAPEESYFFRGRPRLFKEAATRLILFLMW
jgi:hypothetical protein